MFMYSLFFSCLFSLSIKTDGQYNLYNTNPVSETNFYYDCLYYKAFDNIITQNIVDISKPFHQIIPYCISPLNKIKEQEAEMITSNIYSNFTFEELKDQNITAQDLLLWFASIDLVERYQNYLDTPTVILASEKFYKCIFPWFGSYCQYTFKSNEPFSDIVRKTFIAKASNKSNNSILDISLSILAITKLTCYMYLKCNRGPEPLCLDWREICDGQIDCLDDGIDEKNCLDLELNECAENEYRCHNGICIPEQFINDNPNNPDCLDHTDENDSEMNRRLRILGHPECYQNPTFLCEESDPFSTYRGFVCGDGQQINAIMPDKLYLFDFPELLHCFNGRDLLLVGSVLGNALRSSNLTLKCRSVMASITFGKYGIDFIEQICPNKNFPCSISIQKWCTTSTYILLPVLPFIQTYAQFGYWTNKSIIYKSLGRIPWPDFMCVHRQLCPFFPSEFQINNVTCSYVRRTNSFDNFESVGSLFRICLLIDETGNETDCFYPSLFHCPTVSKCISKHRLLDEILDCPDFADEEYSESCVLSHRHRFRCTSENKCISPVLVNDVNDHCQQGEDERINYENNLPFQNLCNGDTDILPVLIDGQIETDETNCEEWPCNNPYTQCDGGWMCYNGADEINCDPTSECYPNHHACVLPTTLQVKCLPIDRAGDGVIDCLGATDEREHCRLMNPEDPLRSYKCLNDTTCIRPLCKNLNQCPFEQNNSVARICEEDKRIAKVLIGVFRSDILKILMSTLKNILF